MITVVTEMNVGAEQHATERSGLCVSLYLVFPNLRPLRPSLSALY